MTRAELVEVVARAMCDGHYGPGTYHNLPGEMSPHVGEKRGHWQRQATAALAAIEAAGLILAERKLLAEAHACMRETGWHLAMGASRLGSDGVLEAACSDVEARLAAVLKAPGA